MSNELLFLHYVHAAWRHRLASGARCHPTDLCTEPPPAGQQAVGSSAAEVEAGLSDNQREQIARLDKLHGHGVLDDEEYAAAKATVLGELARV